MIQNNVWVNLKMLIGLLTSIVSVINHTKCVLLRSQKCTTQPILINLHLRITLLQSRITLGSINS